jgi:hypothetical protein
MDDELLNIMWASSTVAFDILEAEPPFVNTLEKLQSEVAAGVKIYRALGGKHRWNNFMHNGFKFDSSATPPTCKESCVPCSDQFAPWYARLFDDCFATAMHSDDEAAATITDLVKSTRANHKYLREMTAKYGDVIVKRWQRRPADRRAAFLKEVRSDMHPDTHAGVDLAHEMESRLNSNPKAALKSFKGDLRTFKGFKAMFKYFRDHHDTLLLPWLNVESLSSGKLVFSPNCELRMATNRFLTYIDPLRLLALIHHRSQYAQSDWVMFDYEQIKRDFHLGHLRTAYNPHSVIVHGNDHDIGKLVRWNPTDGHNWVTIGYPSALIVFSAQRRLSEILRQIVEALLANGLKEAPEGSRL